jgi:hypothetical protein
MENLSKSAVQSIFRISASLLVAGTICGPTVAFAQLDEVLGKVRQGAEQVSANNPTFYLKSAKAVEPNICLYPSGDPTGIIGPIVFRNSFVATPNCKEMRACSEAILPPDEPMPTTCGAEIPNSRYWKGEEKTLNIRSDGTATLEFSSEELLRVRSCTAVAEPVLTCTTGNIGLFRSEVEYEYPDGNKSQYNWDRFQNLAGRRTETKMRVTWPAGEESKATGNRTTTTISFIGAKNAQIPAHGILATISYKFGDSQASIRFRETDRDVTHYAKLIKSSDGSQAWEITSEINRRPSPPVSRVSFLPASYSVSVEDRSLPDLLGMAGAEAMQTRYLVTVFTEKKHRDETQIFQTEAENSGKSVLFAVKLDQDALKSMNGKSRKIRIHVRAQRAGSPWVDGAVSSAYVYESEKEVKFPKK